MKCPRKKLPTFGWIWQSGFCRSTVLWRMAVLLFAGNCRAVSCRHSCRACHRTSWRWSLHDWARDISSLGRDVRPTPPALVKPFVTRQKNDAADAATASRLTMRSVEPTVTTTTGPGHDFLRDFLRARDLLVCQRTQTVNAPHGHHAKHQPVDEAATGLEPFEPPKLYRPPIGPFYAPLSNALKFAWKAISASAGGMFPKGSTGRRLLNQSA